VRFSGPGQWYDPPTISGCTILVYAEGVKVVLDVLLTSVLSMSAWGQGTTTRLPRFEDYRVTKVFKGVPVPPQMYTGPTNIKKVTNFAGHYMVVHWASAGDHLILDVIDAETGRVFVPPLFPARFVSPECPNCIPTNPLSFGGADFRVNSRLMVLERACPNDRPQHFWQFWFTGCSKYYFLWENNSFRLIR
jgi:hypothetical protein